MTHPGLVVSSMTPVTPCVLLISMCTLAVVLGCMWNVLRAHAQSSSVQDEQPGTKLTRDAKAAMGKEPFKYHLFMHGQK